MNNSYKLLNKILESSNLINVSNLPQRILGKTNVKVSILGLGGAGFLTDMKYSKNIEDILYTAYHNGINFFDTARSYGKGKSEENLSLLLSNNKIRKNVFVSSKTRCRHYDYVMKEVEESLKALKTDYIDLMNVHFVNSSDELLKFDKKDGILSTFYKLKDQKIIRYIGMTGHPNTKNVNKAIKMFNFDTLMCFVNPLKNKNTNDQLNLAISKNMGIIGMKVFGGKTPAKILKNDKNNISSTELLNYALSFPITLTIPAISNKKQLIDNINDVKNFKPLNPKQLKIIENKLSNCS